MRPGLPRTTRAAVLRAFGQPLSLEELPVPELEPGSALVRIEVCTLCGSDAHLWEGKLTTKGIQLPVVPGHEMVGTIAAIHPADTLDALGRELREGDRIAWSEAACGHCHACSVLAEPVLCPNRLFGIRLPVDRFPHVIGGLVEYCYVPPHAPRLKLPDEVPATWAAACGCALKTVIRAFERAGPIDPGTDVVIQGTGPLGLFGTAVALSRGARRVIAIGAPAGRLELARRWGATDLVSMEEHPSADERVELVLELTSGLGAGLVMDFAGGPTTLAEAIRMSARRGRHVVVGTIRPSPEPIPGNLVMQRELTILGSTSGDVGHYQRGLDFLLENRSRFDWDLMFESPVGLERVQEALTSMVEMSAVKAVVVP
jgi:D-arabinose 1-dehydrogenase-like Zn-dependent alcohol dehydrogenase